MKSGRIKTLLIEDNQGDARLIQEMLSEAGAAEFEIVHAEKLMEGLQRLIKERFDVVLLDLSLPDSQGLATFDKVHYQTPGVPILMLTGLDDEALAVKAVQKGAQDYLVKGKVDSNMLVRAIRYAIERHKKQAEQQHETHRLSTGKVLGFIGAKGGVGTTTVVLNVASVLAQQNKRVIAVEPRSDFGTFSLQMNQTTVKQLGNLPENSTGLFDRRELNRRLLKTKFGFRVLVCPTSDQAEAVIKELAGMSDYIVIDLPCNSLTASEAAIRQCDFVGLVVEPEPICVKSARLTLDLLISLGVSEVEVGVVVVNHTRSPSPVSLDAIKSQLGCEIVGVVPPAEDFMVAQQSGAPIVLHNPDSLCAYSLSEVANRLAADTPIAMKF